MSNTAYKIFVMQASELGQDIEKFDSDSVWRKAFSLNWDWLNYNYRIKLSKGWEYVIEDGEIAFRKPKYKEWYFDFHNDVGYLPKQWTFIKEFQLRPIIKRINNES